MFAIADLSFNADTETNSMGCILCARQARIAPPQVPLPADEEEAAPQPQPGNRAAGRKVTLHRGCYPGMAHGELIIKWHPDGYKVIDGYLPDFRERRLVDTFQPFEKREVYVNDHVEIKRCVILEFASDSINGPTFRTRPIDLNRMGRVEELPWQFWTPEAICLYVDHAMQEVLSFLTGITFKTIGQAPGIAAPQRRRQSPPPRQQSGRGRDPEPRHDHPPRRPQPINNSRDWHWEMAMALDEKH